MMIKKWISLMLVLFGWSVLAGQTYHVGDIYTAPDGSQGIVFYLHPDGSGGWVVALHDASDGCQWGTMTDVGGLPNQTSAAYAQLLYDTAGYSNTLAIRTAQNNSDTYAAGKVDFAHGWYLPSPAQLSILYAKLPFVSNALRFAGGEDMAIGFYWSSAEYSNEQAWRVSFDNSVTFAAAFNKIQKSTMCRVRAVRSFTYDYTYSWSSGETEPGIVVSPEQTNAYSVTVSNGQGCFFVDTHSVVVQPLDTTPVFATACENYMWHGVTYDTSGVYSVHYQNRNGCDSVEILYLTINKPIHQSITATGIEGYEWHDSVYTQDGDYLFSHLDANACMQVDTLHLTIYHGTTTSFDTTVCENDLPMEWGGTVFETVGTHIDSLKTIVWADSLVLWTLHVVELPVITHTPDTVILAGDSLTLWATGSEILIWTDGNGAPVDSGATVSVRPLTSVYYYVTGYNNGEIVGDDTSALQCLVMDSIWVEVLPNPDTILLTDSVCAYYVWYGDTLTQSDVYYHTMVNQLGYDSVEVLTLTVFPTTYGTLDTTVLQRLLPMIYNDSVYEDEGTYFQHFVNAQGCDSILTITLSVLYNVTSEIFDTICENQLPFTWNGVVFDAAGTQDTVLVATTGVDSTVVMNLTVNHSTTFVDIRNVCDSLRWIDGNLYTESIDTPTYTLMNAAGCDSVVILNLTVNYSSTGVDTLDVCDSLRWIDGNLYTESTNEPTFTLTNAADCDSVVTLHLTVRHSTGTTITAEIIQNNLPYTLNDSTYTATGTYYQHFPNASGCDSVVTLNLTVYSNSTAQVDTTVCAADLPFTWHGHSFTVAGTFTDTLPTLHGADSVVTYHLTVDSIGATIENITHVTCYGASTGSAVGVVTGGQNPMTYAWTNASGTSVSTSTSMSSRPAGFYTFTVTDNLGCSAFDTLTLNTLNGELQPGTISEDQVVCEGEQPLPFTGTAASGGDNGAYQWQVSTNGTDWTVAPGTNNTQNYTCPNVPTTSFSLRRAWVSESCGTEYSNTVNITLWPNTMDTVTGAVCQGEAFEGFGFDITADQIAAPGDHTFEQHHATGHCDSVVVLILTVYPLSETEVEDVVCEGEGYSDNGFSIAPMETVGEEQLTRTLILQSVAGCDSTVNLHLQVVDTALRIVPLTADFCEAISAELQVVTRMTDYVWSTDETTPVITVVSPGRYSVTASQGDCSNTARFVVEGCDDQLLLPNAITPSRGDGLNDYFSIPERYCKSIDQLEIWIYNRWGELVYYSNDKNFRWNGECRGTIQYQTIYNYVIRYTTTSYGKPYVIKGSVTVL